MKTRSLAERLFDKHNDSIAILHILILLITDNRTIAEKVTISLACFYDAITNPIWIVRVIAVPLFICGLDIFIPSKDGEF